VSVVIRDRSCHLGDDLSHIIKLACVTTDSICIETNFGAL
jgi:hypothetical protein